MASLQDQLLKAGVVDKKKAKKIKLEKHTQAKKQPRGKAQPDQNKQEVETVLAERVARDRAMNKEKQLKAEKKAIQAQIIQLIETNKIDCQDADVPYQFTDGTTIKKIYVTDPLRKQLINGRIAIARHGDNYLIIPSIVAEKINERDLGFIVLHNQDVTTETDEDDPYADYQIPDDLMW